MIELDDRLVRCFAAIFPHQTTEEIRAASIGTLPGWDSLATVTLFALIEEEFGIEIDLERLPELTFEAIQHYLFQFNVAPSCAPGRPVEAD